MVIALQLLVWRRFHLKLRPIFLELQKAVQWISSLRFPPHPPAIVYSLISNFDVMGRHNDMLQQVVSQVSSSHCILFVANVAVSPFFLSKWVVYLHATKALRWYSDIKWKPHQNLGFMCQDHVDDTKHINLQLLCILSLITARLSWCTGDEPLKNIQPTFLLAKSTWQQWEACFLSDINFHYYRTFQVFRRRQVIAFSIHC